MAKLRPTTVGFCSTCEAYVVPYKTNDECPGFDPRATDPADGCTTRKLKKRSMYICDIKDHCDEEGFFKPEDLLEHQRDYHQAVLENVLDETKEAMHELIRGEGPL